MVAPFGQVDCRNCLAKSQNFCYTFLNYLKTYKKWDLKEEIIIRQISKSQKLIWKVGLKFWIQRNE